MTSLCRRSPGFRLFRRHPRLGGVRVGSPHTSQIEPFSALHCLRVIFISCRPISSESDSEPVYRKPANYKIVGEHCRTLTSASMPIIERLAPANNSLQCRKPFSYKPTAGYRSNFRSPKSHNFAPPWRIHAAALSLSLPVDVARTDWSLPPVHRRRPCSAQHRSAEY